MNCRRGEVSVFEIYQDQDRTLGIKGTSSRDVLAIGDGSTRDLAFLWRVTLFERGNDEVARRR